MMKTHRCRLLILIIFVCFSGLVKAGELSLRIGPPSLGNGGTNPVGIPPGIQDLEVGWLTESEYETSVSVVPGILFGKRSQHDSGLYMSLGGGIIIDANGVGLGPYAGFGLDLGSGPLRFNIDFKQAVGISSNGIISPYAMRLGASYDFN